MNLNINNLWTLCSSPILFWILLGLDRLVVDYQGWRLRPITSQNVPHPPVRIVLKNCMCRTFGSFCLACYKNTRVASKSHGWYMFSDSSLLTPTTIPSQQTSLQIAHPQQWAYLASIKAWWKKLGFHQKIWCRHWRNIFLVDISLLKFHEVI